MRRITLMILCLALWLTVLPGYGLFAGELVEFDFASKRSLGQLDRFWAGMQLQGNGLSVRQGLTTVPDSLLQTSFPYMQRPYPEEVLFVDTISVVRFMGGWLPQWRWGEAGDNIREGDLAYVDEDGNVQHRLELIQPRLDPYVSNGYTNLILSLDNVPYDLAAWETLGAYGQGAPPRDYREWEELIEAVCREMVRLYGFEMVNSWSFRMGTEVNRATRGSTHTFDGDHDDYWKWYLHTEAAIRRVLPDAKFGPGEFAGGVEVGGPPAPAVNYVTLAEDAFFEGISFDFLAASAHAIPRWQGDRLVGAVNPRERANSVVDSFRRVLDNNTALAGRLLGIRLTNPGEFNVLRQAFLGFQAIPKYIFQFGFLQSEFQTPTGQYLATNEPGGRGAAWTLYVLLELKERVNNLQGVWHWGVTESLGEGHHILYSNGWLYTILDHLVHGNAYVLDAPDCLDGTQHKMLFVEKQGSHYLVTSTYNQERSIAEPREVSITIPQEALGLDETPTVQWVHLTDDNSIWRVIKDDLAAAGLVSPAYANIDLLAPVGSLVAPPIAGRNYLLRNIDTYEQKQVDSLTLQAFPGAVVETGSGLRLTFTVAPDTVSVVAINHHVYWDNKGGY